MNDLLDERTVSELFPDTPRGYFDHAAVATVPRAVEEAISGVARALSRGTRGSVGWHELTDPAEALLAADFGVATEAITVLANTGTAFNSLARAIPFRQGDEVLVFADDFPSPRLPWRAISEVSTVEVFVAAGADRTDTLIAAITPSTRVVSVTHVHATTGATLDLERLHAACIAADALLLVDGAQAAGLLPEVAVHSDAYVSASYKWMLAGFGAAVVSTSERFDAQAVPGLLGYMNAAPSPRLAVGHSNLFGLAALAAAARVRQQLGLDAVNRHTRGLVEHIARGTVELGYDTWSPAREAGILSLHVADAAALTEALAERGFTTTHREGRLRISPSVTTTRSDADGLLTALADLASVHRATSAQHNN